MVIAKQFTGGASTRATIRKSDDGKGRMLQDRVMRYSVVTATSPKELIDEKGAGIYLHIPQLLVKMEKAGWIKPVVKRGRMKLYRLKHLDHCVDRLEAGEFPER